MREVFGNLDHVKYWSRGLAGKPIEWSEFLEDYQAIVDWPGSAFWQELSLANPDALVILSVRSEPGTWWRSADGSIFDGSRNEQLPEHVEWQQMFLELLRTRLTPDWAQEQAANEAYEAHNDRVRAAAAAGACSRFLEWRVNDGWPPLCDALGVPVPREQFPHL
jgi:hypothetical protein